MQLPIPEQAQLLVVLPLIFSLVGPLVAGFLRQDGFSDQTNEIIAWSVLILSAVLSALINHGLTNDWQGLLSTAVGALTLLVSGAFASLKPWLVGMDWLQAHVFPIVKTPAAPTQSVPVLTPRASVLTSATSPTPVGKGFTVQSTSQQASTLTPTNDDLGG